MYISYFRIAYVLWCDLISIQWVVCFQSPNVGHFSSHIYHPITVFRLLYSSDGEQSTRCRNTESDNKKLSQDRVLSRWYQRKYVINIGSPMVYCDVIIMVFIQWVVCFLSPSLGEWIDLFVCLFVLSRTSNFSANWRLSPLPVTGLQI
jgi:hypothetical protein